ncbi:methyltransferase domain-containing protein [Cerasicoccus arenae]|uniref:Methyltransferase type 11 domain-containing protein n=1 Tax=Cerasicoccus arenae TaxID=424488 RepID=A0A8J3D9C5_9BACT|nr:methyltransferase domain-containing protein [Cerasicoccus arenae]MBK1859676.1 methyltransferase domain-containing protein [Cerasicoccus arenae]GHB92982.1 hypothetical protein GCM10007047_05450 [Cerasicoccus arenae]
MLNAIKKKIEYYTSQAAVWPEQDYELIEHRDAGLFKGKVLNAGCGWRQINHLIDGELTNQDISWPGDTRTHVDVYSPIHEIPNPDGHYDCIICIAVLEHVENPEEVVPEFYRVLKPGGIAVVSVPFLQPEHKCPTDFQRYTKDGLKRLFTHHGFEVLKAKPLFNVFHTFHWQAHIWLNMRNSFKYRLMRLIILPTLVILARRSKLQSEKLASVIQVVVRKPL